MSLKLGHSSRRMVLAGIGVAVLGLAAASFATLGFAEKTKGAAEIPEADLMQPGELPELALGSPDAKVTIIEYESQTCGHCANFANNVFPDFKKKYIDTGKVRFIIREFPLDSYATAGSMLARCASGDRTIPMIETLFKTQHEWTADPDKIVPKLLEIAKQAGFTEERFYACLKDDKLLGQITAERKRAAEVFGVGATPTFFINGKKLDTAPTLEAFDKVLKPLLAKS